MTEGGGTSRTPAGEDHSNGGESNGGEMLTKLHSAVSLARPFSTSMHVHLVQVCMSL